AVKRMPRWKPGTVNGKPTPVRITVPIHFEI
ncbi:MAG: energy transducer TonB, partial [Bacteroidaceae bacterium]|nr:energy transducer TonB [Bacteroidaceae bacterium]